jgi:hypothetical protein
MECAVGAADARDRPDAVTFLRAADYRGDILDSDCLIVAESGDSVVGAFRLVREHGCLVLRGMRVRCDMRRQGVGLRLLGALGDLDEPCYCVPHRHLEGFYGRAGFETLSVELTPDFLAARLTDYRDRGLDVVAMRREPTTQTTMSHRHQAAISEGTR